jgi:hypothetical protein
MNHIYIQMKHLVSKKITENNRQFVYLNQLYNSLYKTKEFDTYNEVIIHLV